MALLPSTQETRMVPVAGRQFAERRLIRGVGAAERAVGNAWGRLDSRQRGYYGSQRNFAGGLQREATRRASKREEDDDNAQREQGRQDAMGNARPPVAPKVNHAKASMGKRLSDLNAGQTVSMRNAGQDHAGAEPLRRYSDTATPTPQAKPRPKSSLELMNDARDAGRIKDDVFSDDPEAAKRSQDRGEDNYHRRILEHPSPRVSGFTEAHEQMARNMRRRAKGYQMESHRRFAERRQLPKPGSYGRIY